MMRWHGNPLFLLQQAAYLPRWYFDEGIVQRSLQNWLARARAFKHQFGAYPVPNTNYPGLKAVLKICHEAFDGLWPLLLLLVT